MEKEEIAIINEMFAYTVTTLLAEILGREPSLEEVQDKSRDILVQWSAERSE